jgi:hypothetical protein
MAYYRVYSFDVMARHIIDVDAFEADSDAAAISKLGPAVMGVCRELWNLGRKVMVSRSDSALPIDVAEPLLI